MTFEIKMLIFDKSKFVILWDKRRRPWWGQRIPEGSRVWRI